MKTFFTNGTFLPFRAVFSKFTSLKEVYLYIEILQLISENIMNNEQRTLVSTLGFFFLSNLRGSGS